MADVKRTPTSLTLSSYFPEIPSKNGDPNNNVRPKRVEDPRAPRPKNQYTAGRRKSSGDACIQGNNDKGTQTNGNGCTRPVLESLFPKKRTHPMSHKVMLLSAVLRLAKKEKISGEVESTLLYYLHREPFIKEAEDLCPMDEDKQAIAFKDIASKLPFPPYPLKIHGDQKSWLQKSIEEELGPSTPYLITGSEKWNRLDFGATVLFGLHLVYTNHMEKEVPDKGLRFRKVSFELPESPPKEWYVVDLCNNLSSSDVTAQDFTARMRRLVADGKLDSKLLLRYSDQFGDESTKGIVKDGTQIFLHQSPQFSTWLKQAAAYHKLGEFTILREYLVAHVLYSLQACGKRVFLKGGCSLSLGYNLINRTSEDIDIRIDPSAGVTWEVNGCENAETSRAEYFLKLLDTMFIEDGEVELMHTKCKTTQALYHITFDLPHHAPITIVLEVMHKVAPLYIPSSKFHQYVRYSGTLPEFKQNYDFEIACVHPWQTLYEKIHAVHQNFNKFQNRCVDGNVNAPKWIRHLGDAYNIIRKTRKTELPEDWSISRLQEELAKSRDFVTDLSHEHPTLRLELLSESERRQVDEAFSMHVEGAYYGVGEEGIVEEERGPDGESKPPTLEEVCETVIGWLRTVPTTFVSVDKFRRFTRGNYHPRGGRHHSSSSSPSDPNASSSESGFQGRNSSSYSRGSSSQYSSKPYSGKKFSDSSRSSSYNKSSSYQRGSFNNTSYPSAAPSTSHNETQTPPTNDEDTSSSTTTPTPIASSSSPLPSTPSSTDAPNISQMSRQVDSSYRLSRDFDKVIEPTHSGSNSETDDSNSTYSNESAPESPALETESPSESSAENTENEAVWVSLTIPRPPTGRRELLVASSDFESVSENASESTSESESGKSESEYGKIESEFGKVEPEFGHEESPSSSLPPVPLPVLPPVIAALSPDAPLLASFNEASFGMPKRNSFLSFLAKSQQHKCTTSN